MSNEQTSKEGFGVPVPRIPEDMVVFLNRVFPERCAELDESTNQIFHRAGQRSVVRFLNRLFEEQNENVL